MADLRIMEFRRKWDARVSAVGLAHSAGGGTEVSEAVGFWAPLVRAIVLKAYLVLGADVAKQASGSVSKTKFELYDRKDDGSGTTKVGSEIENTDALADDILHDFKADGYVVAEDYVIGVERTETDFGTSNAAAVVGPTLIVEWMPFPAV